MLMVDNTVRIDPLNLPTQLADAIEKEYEKQLEEAQSAGNQGDYEMLKLSHSTGFFAEGLLWNTDFVNNALAEKEST